MSWSRILSGPVADGEAASAPRWWFRLFKPVQTSLDDLALDDTDWIVPTLLNSWVDFGSAGWPTTAYRRLRGMVYVRGLVKNGTNSSIFVLPDGFQPGRTVIVGLITGTVAGGTTAGSIRVNIDAAGVVTASSYSYNGSNRFVGLSGIRFLAES